MKGDFTRSTFRAINHYSSVRAQQGRGVLDAELNEQTDITAHVERTTNTDVIGSNGAPFHDVATEFKHFQIKVDTSASDKDLLIGPGRMYVDGILCENDNGVGLRFTQQPDLPNATLPTISGFYAVILEVWERHISASEQPSGAFPQMREVALGGPDTASRLRVVWQVKLAPVDANGCEAFTPPVAPTGRLRATEIKSVAAANDCMVPSSGGYRRLENQLYRVEIHAFASGKTTYKWSRDNASMMSKVRSTDQAAATIVIEDAGRDNEIGFANAKYVELSDEARTLNGQAGVLLEVDTVTGTTIRVKNPTNASLALGANPILRRWDGTGELAANTPTELEDGVQIEFDGGTFGVGDFWLIPARTLTAKVEWAPDGAGVALFEARHGTAHHYATLAVVSFDGAVFAPAVQDCRKLFPPLTHLKASDVAYDSAQCNNLLDTTTVQEALDKLCQSTGDSKDAGIHIKGVVLRSGQELRNDSVIAIGDFLKGIQIDCDETLFVESVINKHGLPNPVCSVTLELPWPLMPNEREFWGVSGLDFVGFQPITLAADVISEANIIVWNPINMTQQWLADRLLDILFRNTHGQIVRVLARLKLRGNFIWGPDKEPKLYLDGEAFGTFGDGQVDIRLPSGNGKRGGDFEMWFWLARER